MAVEMSLIDRDKKELKGSSKGKPPEALILIFYRHSPSQEMKMLVTSPRL
jgi:hypothetical protein